ncbi:DUF7594 domain-containing protein [Dactylosporangium sp. McL0621]|uniref:CBM96 family carbohydrate-binding protein n=1 Tax=Dactylosporangium sp. McL0621 TaxID=3415678 RepID=UPI003CF90211
MLRDIRSDEPPSVTVAPYRRALRALILATVAAVLVGAWVAVSDAAGPVTVKAAADATVVSDQPDLNQGGATDLTVRSASTDKPTATAYVKFTVSGLTGAPAGVQLQLYSYAQSSTGVQVWTAASDWTESAITWNTAPPAGTTMVANMSNLALDTYATADVSSVVTGNGTYTFAITTTSTVSKKFASREVAANPPQLVINTGNPPTVAAVSGSGQTAAPGAAFAAPLVASVTDGSGAPVPNIPVTFTAPSTGASATFTGGASAVSITTDATGRVTSPALTANAVAGAYTVTAAAMGAAAPASFTLANGSTTTPSPSASSPSPASSSSPASPSPSPSPTPTGTVTTYTFKAVADASVRADQPDTNFGADYVLNTSATSATTPQINSYLRFSVSGLSGTITSATLQLYSFSTSTLGLKVLTVPAPWAESTLTYTNAPAMGAEVGAGPNIAVNTWASIDITAAVAGNGTVGLGLTTARTGTNKVASRESAATPPTLVVKTVTGGPTPTPSPSASASAGPTPSAPASPSASAGASPSPLPTPSGAGTTVTAMGGAVQSVVVGGTFSSPLIARVTRPGGATVAGLPVTFTAPATGPSATFPGGASQVTVTTDGSGVATSPPLQAGAKSGTYAVTATTDGAAQAAAFNLTNTDPTIVTAGDIACPIGKSPSATTCQQMATSDLALSLHPDAVLPLGDDQYELGSLDEFQQQYAPSWGRMDPISHPVPGNHEYGYIGSSIEPTGGTGYFTYFGDRAHPLDPGCVTLCKSWYSWDIGNWHMIALDSQCGVIGGCNPGNPQYQWLLADLNANTRPCTLAYWHIPLFSSSQDHQPDMTAIYTLLYNKNADVVLNGHAHFYERFAPQTVNATADPARGLAEFIVGSGGRNFFTIRATPSANSEARIANTFGVLQMTLSENSYSWQFVAANAGGGTDSGSASCH